VAGLAPIMSEIFSTPVQSGFDSVFAYNRY